MKELLFKVIVKKEIEFNLSLDKIRAFPTHNTSYSIFEEKMIVIEYSPAKGFDLNGFAEMMKTKIKKEFKAHSVEIVSRELKEIKTCYQWVPNKGTGATRCANCGKYRWSHDL